VVAFILFIIIVATAGNQGRAYTPDGSGVGAPATGYEDLFGELHYMRARQGLDPEAVPSLAIIGVAKSGATDVYRRLLSRYPSLQAGLYRELNFLTQCQQEAGALLLYRQTHAHCGAGNGTGDPACHGCSPLGYAALFNTSGVRQRLGACPHALPAQALCAGGWLQPDGGSRAPPATGYRPVFTVDASKTYSGSAGAAQRAATLLASISPRTKVVLMLRNPADMGRAVYNAKLSSECGSHECDGVGGGARVPPYETIVTRELAFLAYPTAQALLTSLVTATRPGDARAAELALAANWTAFATSNGWETHLWGKQLFLLHGVYAPILMAWVERFVPAGRPMLVVQSEAYFARAPELVDDVFGTFMFGDADGLRGFAEGSAGLEAPQRVRYGAKASQSIASRCAVVDALRGAGRALEKAVARYQKAGKVQLLRAKATGPMWPRPAQCAPSAPGVDPAAPYATASDYDMVDPNSFVEPDVYSMDYDYGCVYVGRASSYIGAHSGTCGRALMALRADTSSCRCTRTASRTTTRRRHRRCRAERIAAGRRQNTRGCNEDTISGAAATRPDARSAARAVR
jgi:hypothetical protein